MLSIIISSYQPEFYSALEKNIAETIGVSYEIIKIHNPGIMGICEAYNKGANQAKHEFLLFIHEDILFNTKNWGELLINHLKKESIGVIGLAGSNYVPIAPSAWSVINNKYTFGNVNNKENLKKPDEKVFALDGVFLAVRKLVFNEFLFDENVKGFHGYDTDLSLRVATKYQNLVAGDIFIKHFSKGFPDKIWIDNHIQIRKKINYNFTKEYDLDLEITMFYAFLKKYFQYYTFNLVNIKKTLFFLPPNLKFKNKFFIVNEYFHYFLKSLKAYF